ncbi:hypothetical protein [Paraburkholderia jirisanensis]
MRHDEPPFVGGRLSPMEYAVWSAHRRRRKDAERHVFHHSEISANPSLHGTPGFHGAVRFSLTRGKYMIVGQYEQVNKNTGLLIFQPFLSINTKEKLG